MAFKPVIKKLDYFQNGSSDPFVGWIRVLNGAVSYPNTGESLELVYTGNQGYVVAYDRAGSVYTPLNISGITVDLQVSGSSILKLGPTITDIHIPGFTTNGVITTTGGDGTIAVVTEIDGGGA